MFNQEIDQYQQRNKERGREDEQNRNHNDERVKHGHHEQDDRGEKHGSKSCNDERNLRSLQGNVHTIMKLINNSSQEVRRYWLDYSGRRVFYKAIPPYGQYTLPTFQTHPWVITDSHDICMDIFVSNQPSATVEIR